MVQDLLNGLTMVAVRIITSFGSTTILHLAPNSETSSSRSYVIELLDLLVSEFRAGHMIFKVNAKLQNLFQKL
jgi:hypothetical protein